MEHAYLVHCCKPHETFLKSFLQNIYVTDSLTPFHFVDLFMDLLFFQFSYFADRINLCKRPCNDGVSYRPESQIRVCRYLLVPFFLFMFMRLKCFENLIQMQINLLISKSCNEKKQHKSVFPFQQLRLQV